MQTESRPVAATPELRRSRSRWHRLHLLARPRAAPFNRRRPGARALAAPTPYGGSLLGMARSAAPPRRSDQRQPVDPHRQQSLI